MWNPFKKKETPAELPLPTVYCPILSAVIITPIALVEAAKTKIFICKNVGKYQSIQAKTGVPFDVVAAIHYREASFNFNTCLHNGDPLGVTTTHVPKGRGPFASWEDAAVDAFELEKHKFPLVWDTEGKLNFCEEYNGLGYRKHHMPSPYVYAGTNAYVSGLYTSDGKFSASVIDHRLGCAAIIKSLEHV